MPFLRNADSETADPRVDGQILGMVQPEHPFSHEKIDRTESHLAHCCCLVGGMCWLAPRCRLGSRGRQKLVIPTIPPPTTLPVTQATDHPAARPLSLRPLHLRPPSHHIPQPPTTQPQAHMASAHVASARPVFRSTTTTLLRGSDEVRRVHGEVSILQGVRTHPRGIAVTPCFPPACSRGPH